jgi:hypothetical protein
LPAGAVGVHVQGGGDSFFDFILSNVPPGYDVGNTLYNAWCDDMFSTNDPTINGGNHQGFLVSSLSGSLPAPFNSMPWDKINYLINHKQGTDSDIQFALWHFTDGFNPDPAQNPISIQLIADADAHGAGFVPGPGQVVAVLVLWQGADANVQECFIEVPIPGGGGVQCLDRFTSGGFVFRDGAKVTFGIQGGYKRGRLSGGINFVDHGTGLHVHSRAITSYAVLDGNCRRATYDVTIDGTPGTATVRVCDNGEPGVNDVMEITLSNGYSAGVGSTLGGDGPGGGNVQLHKPQCIKVKSPKSKAQKRK